LTPPTVTYEHAMHLYAGDGAINVLSLPGHTGGDSIVVVPQARTVFAGDLFWNRMMPTIIDGSIESWIASLDAMLADWDGYSFVPGHGDVGGRQEVAAFRDYLRTLRVLAATAITEGRAGSGWPRVVATAAAGPLRGSR
jgi:glyoxylase-like metal-dependent hydrolase (beta-lactamase superfamily II)